MHGDSRSWPANHHQAHVKIATATLNSMEEPTVSFHTRLKIHTVTFLPALLNKCLNMLSQESRRSQDQSHKQAMYQFNPSSSAWPWAPDLAAEVEQAAEVEAALAPERVTGPVTYDIGVAADARCKMAARLRSPTAIYRSPCRAHK